MSAAFYHVLLLIVIANGVPVLMHFLLADVAARPLDFGKVFYDGKPLFGSTKTWRGLLASIVVTGLCGMVLGYHLLLGCQLAAYAMLGDLISSFIKRRLGLPSSTMMLFLDQVPESLLPALLLMSAFKLSVADVVILVPAFIILELFLSQIFYRLGIRRTPY